MTRIVIDLSNLAYISLYGVVGYGEREYSKKAFQAICDNKIKSIVKASNASSVVFAKDNYPKRKELDANYKATRHKCEYPIKQDLIDLLLKKGVKIYEAKDKEADDVMATLLRTKQVDCIVTTDQDLLQAAESGKNLFNPVTMSFWDKERLMKKYKLKKFKDILWYKSFFGDSSDNIPKCGDRIPRQKIADIINAHKFHNWKELRHQLKKLPCYDKIDFSRIKLNYKLVKLDSHCKLNLVKKEKRK